MESAGGCAVLDEKGEGTGIGVKEILGERVLLAGLVCASLLIKIIFVAVSQEINQDAVRYINAAHLFSQGEFAAGIATGSRTFLYPWLIHWLHALLPDWVLAGQLISTVATSLAVIPFFLVTKNLFGSRAALWVGLVFVLSPVLNVYSVEIIREPLFLLFFGWALWAMLKVIEFKRPSFALLAFLFASFSFLCRIEAILAPVFFLLFLLPCTFRDRDSYGKRFRYCLYLFVAMSIAGGVAVIYSASTSTLRFDDISLYIYEIFSLKILSNYHFVYDHLKDFAATLPNSQWSHDFGSTAAKFMPLIYFLGLISAYASVLYPPVFALLVYGLFGKKILGPKHIFFLLLTAFYLGSAYVFLVRQNFISERYLLAPAMILMPWFGLGMEKLLHRVRGRRIALTVIIGVFLLLQAGETVEKMVKHEPTIAAAGAWIKENSLEKRQIFFNDERVALYAGLWRGEYTMFGDHEFTSMDDSPPGSTGDWVIYKISAKQSPPSAELRHFELVQAFQGKKRSVFVYKRV